MNIEQPEIISILFVLGCIVLGFVLVRIFDRMDRVKRARRGYDATWLVIAAILLCVLVWGVLVKKGLI
jgi:hypothetical protein